MDIRLDKNTIITVADYPGKQVVVNGKVWSFDYSKYWGPVWLKKNGDDRKCQNPNKAVWAAFEEWREQMDKNTELNTELPTKNKFNRVNQ